MNIASAKLRYKRLQLDAITGTNAAIGGLKLPCRVGEWTGKATSAIKDQWIPRHLDASWDWDEIIRRHREPDVFPFVGWTDAERLSFAALALTTERAVELRFLEGDPRHDCPLQGVRAIIALEACSRYGQGRGKVELRVRPINPTLEGLYLSLGFIKASLIREESYFWRSV